MIRLGKESGDYLGQISNNIEEKVDVIECALEKRRLPQAKDGKIRIVELGTGGGESLRKLKKATASDSNVEMIALDVMPELLHPLREELNVEAVAADAGHMPFESGSISGINASAILHEISSYGTRDRNGSMVYMQDAVVTAFSEMNRVLMPEGIVAYRDVLAPAENIGDIKEVKYSRESWKLFAEWFLDDFINFRPDFYKKSDIEIKNDGRIFSLRAPIGLQREFQRHYLMLRDYLRRVKAKEFGIEMISSPWLRELDGIKSITFTVNEHLAEFLDLSIFQVEEHDGQRIYKGDSDKFDELYDELMRYHFKNANDFMAIIDAWKKREGLEYYLYGDMADVLGLSIESSLETGNDHVLFPEFANDIAIAPRYYYDRYLKQVSDNPEKDGKQIMALKKLSKDNAMKSLEAMQNSGNSILTSSDMNELRVSLEKLP